jgi:hypothetical protein
MVQRGQISLDMWHMSSGYDAPSVSRGDKVQPQRLRKDVEHLV